MAESAADISRGEMTLEETYDGMELPYLEKYPQN